MISLRFKSDDKRKLQNARGHFHNALVGNQSYVDSVIAICDDDNEDSYGFLLVIGEADSANGASFNANMEIDLDDIKFKLPYLPAIEKMIPISIYIRGCATKESVENGLKNFKYVYDNLIISKEDISVSLAYTEIMICGTIPESSKGNYIELTSSQNLLCGFMDLLHVEVLINGKWYGL